MMVFAKINFAKMASLHYMNIISGEIKSVFPAKNLREAFKKKSLTFAKPGGGGVRGGFITNQSAILSHFRPFETMFFSGKYS